MNNEQPLKLIESPKTFRKRVIIVICLLFTVFCLGIFYVQHQISAPISEKASEKEFRIEKGDSLSKIAKNLEKEGLIKNSFYFVLYVGKSGWSDELQAGDYLISPAMNVSQIAKKFVTGEIIPREITITIPEGFKISQIEERLKENNFQFSRLPSASPQANGGQAISNFQAKNFKNEYDFLKEAPDKSNLEGFLFPDTYKFYPEATSEDVVKKMLDNFNKKFTPYQNEVFGTGLAIYDVITMASLIEKEVKTFEDRQIVSGIFWKRLKERRPLESCATIAHILDVDKWRYSIEDTRRPSPYNTYLNIGLPPGPICNPGIESVKAAIFPKESPYNFFLTDPETGNTIFSKTLQEHNLNKVKYFK